MRAFATCIYLGSRSVVSKNTGKPVWYSNFSDGGYTYNFRCNCPDRLPSIPELSKVDVTFDVGVYDNRPFMNVVAIDPVGK